MVKMSESPLKMSERSVVVCEMNCTNFHCIKKER